MLVTLYTCPSGPQLVHQVCHQMSLGHFNLLIDLPSDPLNAVVLLLLWLFTKLVFCPPLPLHPRICDPPKRRPNRTAE